MSDTTSHADAAASAAAPTIVTTDTWAALRALTPARLALGRAGASMPTKPHLEFQLAHARARTAVHHKLDVARLVGELTSFGHPVIALKSAAVSRAEYLQRPDKGRRLDLGSRAALQALPLAQQKYDVAFMIGDGLSAFAIEQHAVAFLGVLLPSLTADGWSIAPISVVEGARIALGDEIGEVIGATLVVVLIGERPGLSSPDSMGVYMTYAPRLGLTDDARNCISNIRREGLGYIEAAHKLIYLLQEARRRCLSGVSLKDAAMSAVCVAQTARRTFLLADD